MTKITQQEVIRLAALAMLTLNSDEVKKMSQELDNIFEMIEEINQFETEGVEETAQVTGLQHVTRDDVEKDYKVEPDVMVKAAAKSQGSQIEVPKVQ